MGPNPILSVETITVIHVLGPCFLSATNFEKAKHDRDYILNLMIGANVTESSLKPQQLSRLTTVVSGYLFPQRLLSNGINLARGWRVISNLTGMCIHRYGENCREVIG